MNFVAIDFETANAERISACSMGLVVVENGIIVDRIYHLIKPTPNKYDYLNTCRHGLSSKDTDDKPMFDEIWNEIEPILRDKYLVAHNAAFDMEVLRKLTDYFNLQMPECKVVCTKVLSRNTIKAKSFGLEDVVNSLELVYENHHHASCDAEMAANVLLAISKRYNNTDIPTLLSDHNVKLGSFSIKGYESCTKKRTKSDYSNLMKQTGHTSLSGDILKKDLSNADPNHWLYNKKIVITGVFDFIDRESLAIKLREFGADINTSISKNTDYVIKGNNAGPTKIHKIEQLQNEGHDIKIIDTEAVKDVLNSPKPSDR